MDIEKIRNALKDLEQVALAYTVKTSSADSPEKFVEDYVKNIEIFKEIRKKEWIF